MNTQTPGPWNVFQAEPYYENSGSMYQQIQIGIDDFVVAAIPFGKTKELTEEAYANLNLIAAAPELLAACKAALLELSGINNGPESKQLAQAIAKAEEVTHE